MRLSSKMARQLFDAVEAKGIAADALAAPLGLDAATIAAPGGHVEWETMAALLGQLSKLVDGDVERLRDVGRAMVAGSSLTFLRRIARTVVSLRSLYEAGDRWLAPATFPHVPFKQTFQSDTRFHTVATVPEPHVGCEAFFHVVVGIWIELPSMLGLPQATVVSCTVTPRRLETTIDLPRSTSLFGRARRVVAASLRSREQVDLLEQQRRDLAIGLEAVQRTTSEVQAIFERLPDLVIIQRGGTILWANRATSTGLGYPDANDLIGLPLLDIVDPVSRDVVAKRMNGQEDDKQPELVETWLNAGAGRAMLVEVAPTQMVSFAGLPARLIVARDVTDRIRLQQQLLTADRMASIGMLAAGVAHEVNNPLAYVLNNVEIAVKALAPLGEATRPSREALAIALEGVDRIRTIVRDLLVLSRVDDREVGPVDVRAVVESTLGLASKKISDHARLTCEYHPVPPVRGTAARLGQILLNLLVNALEAMSETSRATNVLHVAVRTGAGRTAVIEVSDNGIGIRPEHAPRIFDPFFTTKSFGYGTGLGLAISQRLVADSGGTLSFDSVPHKGSTFRVTLPTADDEPEPEPPRSAGRPGSV